MLDQNQNQNNFRNRRPSVAEELEDVLTFSAVLELFDADDDLKTKARPHVYAEKRWIDWQAIFTQDFTSGQRAALLWAKSIWLDCKPAKVDPFKRGLKMAKHLRVAVLKALAIRWGLAS